MPANKVTDVVIQGYARRSVPDVPEALRLYIAQELQTLGGPPSVERWSGHDADVVTVPVHNEAVSDLDLVQKIGERATGFGRRNASLLGAI